MDGESAEEDDVTGIGRENQSQRGWDGVDGDKVNLLKGSKERQLFVLRMTQVDERVKEMNSECCEEAEQ